MTRAELITGFPVNEFTHSQNIFGDLYFLDRKGGLEKWRDYIRGGFLEQHFQQFSEISAVLDSIEQFKDKMNNYRRQGLDVTMHAPFVRGQKPKPEEQQYLEFDFEWLVVPEEYKNRPIKEFSIGDNGENKKIRISGLEAKLEDYKKTIDVASAAGIEILTLHITAPGLILNGQEMQTYADKICELADYMKANNKKVTLAVETGGAVPEQLHYLSLQVKDRTGYQISFNLDTAHLLLDLMYHTKQTLMAENFKEEQAKKTTELMIPDLNKRILAFYQQHKDKIKVIHLTQTGLWADLHSGIEDHLGILSCNEELIWQANKDFEETGIKRYLMIESEPTEEGLLHFIKAKNKEVGGEMKQGSDESLMIFMGRPCNGKSEALRTLQRTGVISDDASVIRSDALRAKYKDKAYSITKWITREGRQIVYDEGFRRAELALGLKQGTVFDATFDQKKNRSLIYDLAINKGVRELYVLDFYCETVEAIRRIRSRDASLKEQASKGIKTGDTLCMRSDTKYEKFASHYEDLDPKTEFGNTDSLQTHIIRVNTTTGINTIELTNPNQKTMMIAQVLKREYKSKYGFDYHIKAN